MKKITSLLGCATFLFAVSALAADKLVLEFNADKDLLSLSHNAEKLMSVAPPTMNFARDIPGNLSERMLIESLKDHLGVIVRIRLNGEIAGLAAELERTHADPDTGEKIDESAWLILLNHPDKSGFLAVNQREEISRTADLVKEIMGDPDKTWEDKAIDILATSSNARVSLASGDLAVYQGGRFEERHLINPMDYKRSGRINTVGRFVIYPPR